MDKLTEISIIGDELEQIDFVAYLPNLKKLYMDDNYITNLEVLSTLSNLEILSVKENPISNWAGLKDNSKIKIIEN